MFESMFWGILEVFSEVLKVLGGVLLSFYILSQKIKNRNLNHGEAAHQVEEDGGEKSMEGAHFEHTETRRRRLSLLEHSVTIASKQLQCTRWCQIPSAHCQTTRGSATACWKFQICCACDACSSIQPRLNKRVGQPETDRDRIDLICLVLCISPGL